MSYPLRIEPLEARVAPAAVAINGNTATWTDVDGDTVTVKTTRGTFTAGMFTTVDAGLGLQLQLLDVHADANFKGAAITFTAKRSGTGGDGFVNVGMIDASGLDLAAITVPGDLGKVLAGDTDFSTPGLKTFKVQSMGRFGTTTQGGGDLNSEVKGKINSFTAKTDLVGVDFFANGGISVLKVGGSLIGGSAPQSGRINATTLGSVTIGGSLIGGDGNNSGELFATLGITGPVTIGGSIIGGAGMSSGHINSLGDLGPVIVKHDVRGGSDERSGLIEADDKIISVKIGGSLIGGAGEFSGSIRTGDGGMGAVTIGGSLIAGSSGRTGILSAGALGTVKIAHEVSGTAANPARISGGLGIASVSIGGSVRFGEILAGVNEFGTAFEDDVTIGPVVVGGNWIASTLAAGVDVGADAKFGTADDRLAGGGAGVGSLIKSIVIRGEARGTDGGTDAFAFEARKIGSLKFGKGKIALTPDFDQAYIGPTFDFIARELDPANPSAPDGPPTFGSAPLVISPDGKTASYTDADGDMVTVKTDRGKFKMANFTMAPGPQGGLVLQLLNIAGDPDFIGKNASITFTAKPFDGDGDGFVDVGAIDASGADVKKIVLPGDLGVIKGDGVATLILHSLGGRGLNTQAGGGTLHSDVGKVGTLKIATDLYMAVFATDGDLGTAKIGSIVGGSSGAVGELVVDGNSKSITIAHDLRGGSTIHAGRIKATGSIAAVKIGGSVFGGAGEDAGSIEGVLGIGAVTIRGSMFGGAGENSGSIYGRAIKSVKVGGDLVGGTGAKSGTIYTDGPSADAATIGAVTIGGSVVGGSILSGSTLGVVKIAGSIMGTGAAAKISAQGIGTPTVKAALAIKSVAIGGSAFHADLLAGYDIDGNPTNADVQIGAVAVKGDWIQSNLVAGIDANLNGFGDGDDIVIAGGEQAAVVAKIASITIGGMALGDDMAGTNYAFTAQEIGALKIGTTKLPLSKTLPLDAFAIGVTGDLRLIELA